MKSKFLFPAILLAGLMLANFSVSQVYGQTPQNEPAKQQAVMYTCSMHPEAVQDHPGNCPKCGMKLVEKKCIPKGNIHQSHDSTYLKHDHMKMMPDSAIMRKESTMQNTKFMKYEDMDM